jgi:hypothetical protein
MAEQELMTLEAAVAEQDLLVLLLQQVPVVMVVPG